MSILSIVMVSAGILLLAYFTYGRFLARTVFRLDNNRPAPAVEMADGIDYVPAEPKLLLGQHFSAIAAAGPITGPILAGVMFGWMPALLWIVLGSIFIGGVHDMGSLIASVRHQARSITEVVRENVSKRAYLLFMAFVWIALVYIIVVFTDITAGSFVGMVTLENGEKVGGGGIATSSLLYLILPVIMGLLLRFTRLGLTAATIIFLPLAGLSIWIGQFIPFDLGGIMGIEALAAQQWWDVFILIYCFGASLLPMWLLLQPRGYLGGYLLYAALLAAAVGILFGGYRVEYPAFTGLGAGWDQFLFPLFPLLFITVACGACSGFHSLVGSGTTSKQIKREGDVKIIGYGAMLLEGLVAIIALACVMVLAKEDPLTGKAPNFIYASGIGGFLKLLGVPPAFGISFGLMAFTTFVYDTLDVSARLGRYIIEELTGWRGRIGKMFAAAVTAGIPIFFVMQTVADANGNPAPAWRVFWNVFGASNQLLAGLALVGVTVWLYRTGTSRRAWLVSLFPAVWMIVMSDWALLRMMAVSWFKQGRFQLNADLVPLVALVLVLLSVLLVVETAIALAGRKKTPLPAK